jgi:hypothetical protein
MTGKVKLSVVEDEAPVASIMKAFPCIAGCEAEVATIEATGMQPAPAGNSGHLKFVREYIFQTNFQFHQDGFQLVQSQTMLAMLNAKKRLVGHPNPFGELCIRKVASFLAEEFCQLSVQIALHKRKVAKMSSRMRDDFYLRKPYALIKYQN